MQFTKMKKHILEVFFNNFTYLKVSEILSTAKSPFVISDLHIELLLYSTIIQPNKRYFLKNGTFQVCNWTAANTQKWKKLIWSTGFTLLMNLIKNKQLSLGPANELKI